LELLLVLTLIAVVLQYIPSVYSTMRKTRITAEQQKQSMQRFEVIYHQMRPLVSLAGFYGCSAVKSHPKVEIHGLIPHSGLSRGSVYTLFKASGEGWLPPLPAILQGKVAVGTDALIVESVGPWSQQLLPSLAEHYKLLRLAVAPPPTDWFVISDCQHVEFFQGDVVNEAGIRGIRPRTPLIHSYDHTAMISPWQITAFYLDKHPQTTGYSLNRKLLLPHEAATSFISGIEHWSLSLQSDILEVALTGGTEPITVWIRFEHVG
jgi:hypothetical protein